MDPPTRQYSAQYQPLDSPTTRSTPGHSRSRSTPFFSFHRARSRSAVALAAVPVVLCSLALLCYHFVFRFYLVDEFVYGVPDVPDYDEYLQYEDSLPQHNASIENRRYLMFSNQAWGYGLNNQLQEVLLLSHVAYMAQRAYVFQSYTWDANTDAKAVLDGRRWRSARIPLNVFISGPTAGGEFAHNDNTPRAVNVNWWEQVCPPERRKVVDVAVEHERWNVNDQTTQGGEIADRWAALLRSLPDDCVEVIGPTIFNFGLIASPRILSIWPSFSLSPILSRFAWSNLITAAVLRNLPLFHDPPAPSDSLAPHLPDGSVRARSSHDPETRATYSGGAGRNRRPPSPVLSSLSIQSLSATPSTSSLNITAPVIPGLIAVHLRRGDFKLHCHWLADRFEPFAGWNQFPYLLDRFNPPPSDAWRKKVHEAYMERCWPEVPAIVAKLREVRRLHPGLERVFVLTNGKKDWVDSLKAALLQAVNDDDASEGSSSREKSGVPPAGVRVQPVPPSNSGNAKWKAVLTSRDLDLLWSEREIDQAIDMEIARRAEVFLGNGFSSLTSNVVMLKLADGSPIQNIRFW